ncbi:MAG: PAS domain S-box protein, partial [Flavobacteriales bacterium]|nr:PAS domain S-box protein [Flavobacteriales bacterium]
VMISSKLLNLGGHKVMQAFVWDLTERKKAEEEIRVRNRAFASVGDGIMITDPKQNDNPIIYCNAKFLDITGYSSNEVIGRNPRFLQGEKSDKTTKSAINKAIRERVLFQGELENYRKDGTTYWCEVTITPVFDDHGELQNYIGLQRDITAKKAAEKAIKDAELRFRTLFEQSPDGIVIMDPETLCPVSFNTKAHEQLGYSAEEFSRSKVTDADPRSVKEIMAQAELILRTGKAEFETQLRKSGGELMDVQVTAVLMELQDSPVIYSVYRDITKRKRNEQELKRLSLVASSVENAVYITDPEFNSVWVNKSFEQLTGFSMDELQDKKPTAFYNAEAFKSPNVEEWMKSLFQGLSVSEELWLKRKDGLRYWAQVHATPVMNEHGKVEQIIAIMSNIPVRKKAEMQRDDLLKSLEEKVIERTEELTEANISLENRNKDISDSINYAKYIQDAFIPALKAHDIHVNGAFVVNRPKDVLSGDFHWHYYSEINNCSYVALGDCTGHGVPGSLMTMLAIQLLEQQIVGKEDTQNPKTVLEKIDKRMIDFLHQDDSNNNVADGMEVVLIRIDHSDMQLIFSHVGRSVYFNMNGELKIFDRTNEMVGGPRTSDKKSFSLNRVPYERGYRLYAFSDGLADQFGGPSGKKFLRKRVRDLLLEIQERPFEQHRQLLDTKFTDWKGDEDQVDDVIMLGLEL